MVDYSPILYEELSYLLDCEIVRNRFTEETQVPCVVYQETVNQFKDGSDKREYSDLVYTIKVYTNDVAQLKEIANDIDTKMRELHFKRTYTNFTNEDDYELCIMNFTAVAEEFF